MAEKSAGVIIFRREDGKILYLIMKYGKGHWDFAKGHVESGESDEETALREVQEETGIIDMRLLNGFKEIIHYEFEKNGKAIPKEVVFFLSETGTTEVQLSSEHNEFAWLPFKEAVAKATYDTAKELLKKADKFLKNYYSGQTAP